MDIDTSYFSTLANQSAQTANANKLKSTLSEISKGNNNGGVEVSSADDAKLLEACKEFESYFVEQMYKQMMKTVPTNELDSGSNSMLVDYYKDNLVKEYASATTEQSSLGLAQMLYEQMKRNIGQMPEEIDAKAAAESGAVAAADESADTESASADAAAEGEVIG